MQHMGARAAFVVLLCLPRTAADYHDVATALRVTIQHCEYLDDTSTYWVYKRMVEEITARLHGASRAEIYTENTLIEAVNRTCSDCPPIPQTTCDSWSNCETEMHTGVEWGARVLRSAFFEVLSELQRIGSPRLAPPVPTTNSFLDEQEHHDFRAEQGVGGNPLNLNKHGQVASYGGVLLLSGVGLCLICSLVQQFRRYRRSAVTSAALADANAEHAAAYEAALKKLSTRVYASAKVAPKAKKSFLSVAHTPATPAALEAAEAQTDCSVCLADFADGDVIRNLPCGHAFHAACIDEWLLRKIRAPPPANAQQTAAPPARIIPTCPLCKRDVDLVKPPAPPAQLTSALAVQSAL